MNKALRRVLAWLPVACMMGVIFAFSAQSGEASGALSDSLAGRLFEIADRFLPQLFTRRSFADALRNAAHFSLYFLLSVFAFFALATDVKHRALCALYAFLFCLFYAVTDEIHQAFVPGRAMQLTDVVTDASGAFCGLFLVLFFLLLSSASRRGKQTPREGE